MIIILKEEHLKLVTANYICESEFTNRSFPALKKVSLGGRGTKGYRAQDLSKDDCEGGRRKEVTAKSTTGSTKGLRDGAAEWGNCH